MESTYEITMRGTTYNNFEVVACGIEVKEHATIFLDNNQKIMTVVPHSSCASIRRIAVATLAARKRVYVGRKGNA